MSPLWRYRPANHRTPKLHPIIGHLEWDQVYDHPACEHEPDFVPVPDETATPDSGPEKPAKNPGAQSARPAGKPGKE